MLRVERPGPAGLGRGGQGLGDKGGKARQSKTQDKQDAAPD